MDQCKKLLLYLAAPLAILPGCSVPKAAVLPEAAPLPAKYEGLPAGNMNIALKARDAFFEDAGLRAVIGDVLQGNPDIRIAIQRINIAAAYLKMSKGAMLPAISGLAQASATRFGKYTMEGVGNFDTNRSGNIEDEQRVNTDPVPDYWLGLNASWEADLWGKLRNRKKAEQNRFWASREAAHWITSMLVSQAATLYYELLALDKEAQILEQNRTLQEKALEIVKIQKEAGRATALAVLQFEAQVLNTASALYLNRQRITETTNQLLALSGRYTGTIMRDQVMPSAAFSQRITTGIPVQLLENRPDIKEAALLLEASKADVLAARAAFFPSLNISAYGALHSFNANMFLSLSSISGQLLGGLTAPIFQRHEIRSHFRIATAEQEQAFYQYQGRVLEAYRETATLLQALETSRQMFTLKQQEVEALDKGVATAQELYLNGYANYLEIIAAQKSKLEAELELINIQREMLVGMVTLYKAAGGGWQ